MSERIPVLKTENLGITFGGLRAVSDFNIEIYEGELIGLIGPNGAGKTTVFNLLTGVYQPTEGSVYLCGEKLNGRKIHQFVDAGIARTFQNIRLFSQMTVAENVKVAFSKDIKYGMLSSIFRTPGYWKTEREIEEKAMNLLSIFKLEGKADYLASALPYGEQRKLEIARALASNPKLLLLDEPAAGMNPQETEELRQMIELIRKEFKLTVLLIEHDMKFVMNICERIMVLNYGRIIAEGSPAEIKSNPDVIKAYLGSEAGAC